MRRLFGASLLLSALMLWMVGTPTTALAATTYHGIFAGEVSYVGCTPTPPPTVASGTWNVALHGTSDATVSVNIFTDGAHHVSFGGVFPQSLPTGAETFVLGPVTTGAGPLTISLTGDTLSYRITDYNLFGITCPGGSVTYSGSLQHGG